MHDKQDLFDTIQVKSTEADTAAVRARRQVLAMSIVALGLRIRKTSGLFRMATFDEVQKNLTFLNTGTSQVPGLIVMELTANGGFYGPYRHIVVVFNAMTHPQSFTAPVLAGLRLKLHPVERNTDDPALKTATFDGKTGAAIAPAPTTVVFVDLE